MPSQPATLHKDRAMWSADGCEIDAIHNLFGVLNRTKLVTVCLFTPRWTTTAQKESKGLQLDHDSLLQHMHSSREQK